MAKKIPWEQKYKTIVSQYPQIVDVSWSHVLREDNDVFARLLGDVLKSGGRGSRPGKRPQLDRAEAISRLAKLNDEDYSEYDFNSTFRSLCGDMSVRAVALKTGLAKSFIHRLLLNEATPSFETMEKIAEAFDKHPSFFLEYRIARVLVIVEEFLSDSPETATAWYLKVSRRKQ
jgi:hypothetical protein